MPQNDNLNNSTSSTTPVVNPMTGILQNNITKIIIIVFLVISILLGTIVGFVYYATISFGKSSWINNYTQNFVFENSFLASYVPDAKKLLDSISPKIEVNQPVYNSVTFVTEEKYNDKTYNFTLSKNFSDNFINLNISDGSEKILANYYTDNKILALDIDNSANLELQNYFKSKLQIPGHVINNSIVDSKLTDLTGDFSTRSVDSQNEYGLKGVNTFGKSESIYYISDLAKALSAYNVENIIKSDKYTWSVRYMNRESINGNSYIVIEKKLTTNLKEVCFNQKIICELKGIENFIININQKTKINAANPSETKTEISYELKNPSVNYTLSEQKVALNNLKPPLSVDIEQITSKKNELLAKEIDEKYTQTKLFHLIIENPPKYRFADYRVRLEDTLILSCGSSYGYKPSGCTSANDPRTINYYFWVEEIDQRFDNRQLAEGYLGRLKSGLTSQYNFNPPYSTGFKHDPDLISYQYRIGTKFTIKSIEGTDAVLLTIMMYNFLE